MTIYEYSNDYSPAAPIVEVYIGTAGTRPTVGPLIALIDTGADLTIVPLSYLQQIKAPRISQGQVRSLWGDTQTVDVYAVALAIQGLQFSALQVLADATEPEIILGRTVLNRLKIVLDGPSAMLELVSHI